MFKIILQDEDDFRFYFYSPIAIKPMTVVCDTALNDLEVKACHQVALEDIEENYPEELLGLKPLN